MYLLHRVTYGHKISGIGLTRKALRANPPVPAKGSIRIRLGGGRLRGTPPPACFVPPPTRNVRASSILDSPQCFLRLPTPRPRPRTWAICCTRIRRACSRLVWRSGRRTSSILRPAQSGLAGCGAEGNHENIFPYHARLRHSQQGCFR